MKRKINYRQNYLHEPITFAPWNSWGTPSWFVTTKTYNNKQEEEENSEDKVLSKPNKYVNILNLDLFNQDTDLVDD